MKILAIILFCLWALVSVRGDENLTLDTKNGKVKKTSSNTGSPTKPINFSDVTVTGISGGGGGGTPIPGPTGPPGADGAPGATGPQGSPGPGVATGGTANQVLSKIDSTNYNTQWTTLSAGGNVSNSGTPTAAQKAVWTDATHIQGVTDNSLQWDGGATNLVAATGRTSLGLVVGTNVAPATSGSSILKGNGSGGFSNAAAGTDYAAATSGNSILYGNGSGGFSNVTVGTGLSFTTGTLTATGSGNVSNTGTPVDNQLALWTAATTLEGDSTLTYNGGATGILKLGGTDLGLTRDAASVLQINNGTLGQWGAIKAGVRDAATATTSFGLTVGHQSTGTPSTSFGTGILLNGNSDTTADRTMGQINAVWAVATDASRAGVLDLRANKFNGTAGDFYIFTSGGVNMGTFTDPGANVMNATGGYKSAGTTPTSGGFLQSNAAVYTNSTYTLPTTGGTTGQILQSGGTNVGFSTPTWPITAGAAGKHVESDGTNLVMSTPTYPTAAGAAGYTMRSNATNFQSYPAQLINSSVSAQSPSTSDVYLAGSNIVVAAGDFKATGQYKCVFDMTKSAGTGAIVITLRVGVNGTTADAAIQTYTFGAGTSVADTGIFEVIATWRTVGSGTSAVMQGICRGTHLLATTGLFNNAAGWVLIGSPSPSSGFASNTATNIGISFNGSTAFAGTTQVVQAQLQQ